MRLIDADELIKAFNEAQVEFDEYYKGLGRAKVITDNAPTVDAIPNAEGYEMYNKGYVQGYERGKAEARPQGEWIEGKNGNIKCNKCGCEIRYSYLVGNKPDLPKFCCDCGADMRKGDTE